MTTIQKMLAHIHSLTHDARTGHVKRRSKRRAHEHMPSFLKHDLAAEQAHRHSHDGGAKKGHADKALLEAERAMSGLTNSDKKSSRGAKTPSKKKMLMLKKMKALQEQIQTDFKSVIAKGHKAGYLPPLKMPKM